MSAYARKRVAGGTESETFGRRNDNDAEKQ